MHAARRLLLCWSQAPMMPLRSMAALEPRCRLPVLTHVRLPAGSTRTRRTSCWRGGARCRRASTPARSPTSCPTPARCTSCWSRIDAATASPVRLDSNLSASSCMLLAIEDGAQLQPVFLHRKTQQSMRAWKHRGAAPSPKHKMPCIAHNLLQNARFGRGTGRWRRCRGTCWTGAWKSPVT